ncbi:hypothetical protein G3489_24055 [Shewanella baltica]|nr:hypothetical protein [Shewanella baltica]
MNLGLNDKDVRRYSLINAVRASITGNWKGAGFEREISVALADKMGKDARGFYVNYEVLAQLGRAAQSTGAGMGASWLQLTYGAASLSICCALTQSQPA